MTEIRIAFSCTKLRLQLASGLALLLDGSLKERLKLHSLSAFGTQGSSRLLRLALGIPLLLRLSLGRLLFGAFLPKPRVRVDLIDCNFWSSL